MTKNQRRLRREKNGNPLVKFYERTMNDDQTKSKLLGKKAYLTFYDDVLKDINENYGMYQAGSEVGQRGPLVNYTVDDVEPSDVFNKGGKDA
jgi:hypothetical protein